MWFERPIGGWTAPSTTVSLGPMTSRPLIGLPGRRKRIGQLAGFPESLNDLHVDLYFADYARSVLKAGGLAGAPPARCRPVGVDRACSTAIVLTGGADIEPERYGHDNTDSTTEPHRDEIEFALLHNAIDRQLPVLGICRGLQVVNVYNGGTLNQHVPDHMRIDVAPHEGAHRVLLEPGTHVARRVRRRGRRQLIAPPDDRSASVTGCGSAPAPTTARSKGSR